MARSFVFNPFTSSFDVVSTVTLAAVGSTPNANGASITATGQVLTLQPANTSFPGALTAADWNTFNNKLSSALINTHILVGNGSNVATDVAVSGDVTLANTGAFTIANNVVSNAKLAQMAANTIKGNNTGSTANALDLTVAQVNTLLGDILANGTVAFTANQSMGSNKLTSVLDPTAAQDAATKNYVDNVAAGINPAVAVQAATTSASDTSGLTYTHVAGIGDFFTGSNNTPITADGYTFTAVNQRILIKNDTQSPSGAYNGVYYVTQIQTAILPPILTRALDYDTPSDINYTGTIPVVNGTVNGTTSWVQTALISTVGTDPLVFVKFTRNPADYLLIANNLSDVNSTTTAFNNLSPMTTLGDIIYGGASGSRTRLAGNTTATPKYLKSLGSGGLATAPTFTQVDVSDLSGVATVAQGGTGQSSYTDGQLLIGNTSGNTLTKSTLTAGTGVTITNGNGSITIASSASSSRLSPNVQSFLSGSGTYGLSYWFTVTSASATVGATYTNNGNTFTVARTVASSTTLLMTSNGAPLTSGTLTKSGGTGDSTITFSAALAPYYIEVIVSGGGGGGGSSGAGGSNGSTGGTSTFGSSLLTAVGGTGGLTAGGAGGTGGAVTVSSPAVAVISVVGGSGFGGQTVGTNAYAGGIGGTNPLGGAGGTAGGGNGGTSFSGASNTGGGGGGGGVIGVAVTGGGGGAGGYIDAIIYSPSATYAYAVGAAGAANNGGASSAAGAGGSGVVTVKEFF